MDRPSCRGRRRQDRGLLAAAGLLPGVPVRGTRPRTRTGPSPARYVTSPPPEDRMRCCGNIARIAVRALAALPIGITPGPLEWQPPGMRGDQLVDRIRAPRAGRVHAHRGRRLQQRYRNFPEALDA